MNYQNNSKQLKVILVGGLLVVGLLVVNSVIHSLKFHLVSTNPSANDFSISTPILKLNYNKSLSESLTISATPSIITSTRISGKVLYVTLKNGLDLNQKYEFRMHNVSSVSGARIADQTLSFTARSIDFNSLPTDQQQAILKRQTAIPYGVNSISYSGTDSLVNVGLSTSQLQAFKQAIFTLSAQQKSTFLNVIIDASSVNVAPHDPTSESTASTITFDMSIDKTNYSGTLKYQDLTSIELFLSNTSGQAVFDSGVINGDTN